jgi:hypothetical protein
MNAPNSAAARRAKWAEPPLLLYTASELREFDKLTMLCSSRNQMDRIHGRLETQTFVKKHGEAKCNVMFEEIKRRDRRKRTS